MSCLFRFANISDLDFNLEELSLPFRLTTLGLWIELSTSTVFGTGELGLGSSSHKTLSIVFFFSVELVSLRVLVQS